MPNFFWSASALLGSMYEMNMTSGLILRTASRSGSLLMLPGPPGPMVGNLVSSGCARMYGLPRGRVFSKSSTPTTRSAAPRYTMSLRVPGLTQMIRLGFRGTSTTRLPMSVTVILAPA